MTEKNPSQKPAKAFPRTYDAAKVEPRIYQFWLENGFFAPEAQRPKDESAKRQPFTIALPPPNITGDLHIGHALCYLTQDIVGRRARMQGRPTLMLPGMDHAGIATQNVVERQLAAEGLSRHDLGRERFTNRCWEFVNNTMPAIRRQFQRLGFSFDWRRERFTLDEAYRRAVNRAFAHFYRKDSIYQGFRLVNWCPRCATSISDLEVEYVERRDVLFTIAYPISPSEAPDAESGDAKAFIVVATTRPETMLGDTAIAVHPNDLRYAKLIGRAAILPLLGRRLPIIADAEVDPQFGTGAVKVTPAHDALDYELAARHSLEIINVVGDNGRMAEAAGPFAGLTIESCRDAVLDALRQQGLLIQQEPYIHSVGTCERCHTVIEPLMSRQWFIKMADLAAPAVEAVRTGRVHIEPEHWQRVYLHWMEHIRDWCISRQLWWGHRIPIWNCGSCGAVLTISEDETPPATCEECGGVQLEQETDVLDTWFSSALWPFATLGWPDESDDLRTHYPGDFLGTAGEIIFLWVARMIMEGIEFMGQEPFSRVYINPTVLTEDGRRMSKSLGTGVDPLDACDRYGADAVRWALIRDNTLAQTVRFSEIRANEGQRFANKLWNATRFVLSRCDGRNVKDISASDDPTLPDRWVMSRLDATIVACDAGYDELRFDRCAQALYDFLWGEFCDWYLEIAKHRLDRPVTCTTLRYCLDKALHLLHPLMPFVAEEIWGHIWGGAHGSEARALIIAPWPEAGKQDLEAEEDMATLLELTRRIRNARATLNMPPGEPIAATIVARDNVPLLAANLDWLAPLARLDEDRLTIQATDRPAREGTTITAGPFTCYLPEIDGRANRQHMAAELKRLNQRIAQSQTLLAGEFSRRAPEDVVQRERDKLAHLCQRRSEIREQIARS